jgi:hypothetical protein
MTALSVRVRWWRMMDWLRRKLPAREPVQTINLDLDGKTLLVFSDQVPMARLALMQTQLGRFLADDQARVAILDGIPGPIRVIRVQH